MPLINYVAVIGIAMAIVFHAFVPRHEVTVNVVTAAGVVTRIDRSIDGLVTSNSDYWRLAGLQDLMLTG